MIRFIFTILIIWFVTYVSFGQRVKNVTAEYDDRSGYINIYYDLISFSGQEEIYQVRAFYSEDDGENFIQIQDEASRGDFGDGISSGLGKKISWDFFVENPGFSGENVIFKVQAKWDKSFEIKRLRSLGGANSAWNSLLVPGWGHEKVTGKKGHWWTTAAIYSVTGAGLYFAFSANDRFRQYKRAQDRLEAADLLDQANQRGKVSLYLLGAGASMWISNMVWVAIRGSKNKQKLNELLSVTPSSPILLGYNSQTQTMGFQLKFKF